MKRLETEKEQDNERINKEEEEEEEKRYREQKRKEAAKERQREEDRKDNLFELTSNEKQPPRKPNQVFVVKTDKIVIIESTVQKVINKTNGERKYIQNSEADQDSHEAALELGFTKGFPEGRSMAITRIPDQRALDATHERAKVYCGSTISPRQ
jgi:hypothetical protein